MSYTVSSLSERFPPVVSSMDQLTRLMTGGHRKDEGKKRHQKRWTKCNKTISETIRFHLKDPPAEHLTAPAWCCYIKGGISVGIAGYHCAITISCTTIREAKKRKPKTGQAKVILFICCLVSFFYHLTWLQNGVMQIVFRGFIDGWNQDFIRGSRWWFWILFIFIPIWGRFPFWLIFFKWVETTN